MTAGLAPALMVALAAGMLSFLSPCVLPIVPPYLAYISGMSLEDLTSAEKNGARRRGALLPAAFFVLGLSTVFILLGFTASAFGMFILTNQEWFVKIAGVVVIVFGLHFLGVLRVPLLDREARFSAGSGGGGPLGAFVLGLAFALGWTPCIGPQLGMILPLAATEETLLRGTLLLAVYAAGLGIPFLLTALFIERAIPLINRLKPHMGLIERIMGGLLIAVGLSLFFGSFSAISYWLLETFPILGSYG